MSNLTFNDINFTPVCQNNQIWLTSVELAKALGYSRSDYVTAIYNRKSDEFTSNMTQIIEITENDKLTVSENSSNLVKKIRIFSLRGCHLIAMFARTAIAKEFRKWVLDVLDKEIGEPVQVRAVITTEQRHAIQKAIKQMCLTNKQNKGYDTPAPAKSGVEIGVSYFKSGISTHPVRKGVCFYTCNLPMPCACFMVGCTREQQCSPFLLSGTPILCNPSPFRLASFGGGQNNHYQENQTMKALSFNGVTLTPVHHNSQIYLTSAELAKALGYSSEKSVTNLYNANSDEFTDCMTTVIESMTNGINNSQRKIKTRIFSLRGCHLIAMFARTAIAKEFRKWVLDVLDKEIGEPVQVRAVITTEQRHAIQKAIKAKCQHNSTHYQTVYHALYDHFKVESYKELLASDFDEAMAFITDFNLADDVSEYNSLWKLIGLLEYERIDKEIRELKRTIDTAYQQIERISRTKGLIYDAISEQKTNCPYNTNRLNEAKAFIEKQMVLKKQLGLIA